MSARKKKLQRLETEATKAAKEKVSRDAVVAYAKQFVGNRMYTEEHH